MINFSYEELNRMIKNYMCLDYKQVDSYLNNIAQEKSCTRETVDRRLDNYIFKFGMELYNVYLNKKNRVMAYKRPNIKKVKDLINDYKENKDIKFYNYGLLEEILKTIGEYLEFFPEDKLECDEIKTKITEYLENYGNLKVNNIFSLNMRSGNSNYIEQIREILICKTDGEAVTYMRNHQFTDAHFNRLITNFEQRYINSNEYIDRLKYLYEQYKKFIMNNKNIEKIRMQEILESKKEQYDYCIELISRIIDSNCSIEEFCHYNQYNIGDIKKCIRQICNGETEKIKSVVDFLNRNENSEFINIIKEISEKIISDDSYEYYDYLFDTKLNINDFVTLSKKYNFIDKKIHIFFSEFKGINMQTYAVNRETILNGQLIIKNRVITREEIEKVFEFLDRNSVKVNLYTYKRTLNRYLENKIDLEEKIDVKRYKK